MSNETTNALFLDILTSDILSELINCSEALLNNIDFFESIHCAVIIEISKSLKYFSDIPSSSFENELLLSSIVF